LLVGSGFGVEQVVSFDDCGVGIREKCEGVAVFGAKLARSLRQIDADGCDANALRLKIAESMLDAP
jgi:hypothetical protein